MTIPCPKPCFVFHELYQELLTSITVVTRSLPQPDFILRLLLAANKTLFKFVSCFLNSE